MTHISAINVHTGSDTRFGVELEAVKGETYDYFVLSLSVSDKRHDLFNFFIEDIGQVQQLLKAFAEATITVRGNNDKETK